MGSAGEPPFFYQSAYTTSTPTVISASGLYLTLENGQKVLDSTSGAAVSAIGHGNTRVKDAIIAQLDKLAYAHPGYFQNNPALELADFLVQSTGGKLSRACLVGSGTLPSELILLLTRLIGEHRLRGNGGCHEACPAISFGTFTKLSSSKVHCKAWFLAWMHLGNTILRRFQAQKRAL
jgi:hypothetical protein